MMNQTLVKQVEAILTFEPDTRNSDIRLTIRLWERYYKDLLIYHPKTNEPYIKLERLFDLPREDNIKRVRAKIQNEERRYLPTDAGVFVERARLSEEWKAYLGYQAVWMPEMWEGKLKEYFNTKIIPIDTYKLKTNQEWRKRKKEAAVLEMEERGQGVIDLIKGKTR